MSSAPNPSLVQAAWARLVIDGLVGAGVEELVISPGSRSTPLVLAAARSKLNVHVIIDERSAGFFALGQAKETGKPSALLCTSGSAASHYHPAVIEAAHAFVPMIIVTADRPLELHDCQANQVVDQTRMYGHHLRGFFDLGTSEASRRALTAVRRRVTQAVYQCTWPTPGAVQINVRFRKPLEGAVAKTPADAALEATVESILKQPTTRSSYHRAQVDDATVGELAGRCHASTKGLIVCGPAGIASRKARTALRRLVTKTGFPALVEAASQMRFLGAEPIPHLVDNFDIVLRSDKFSAEHKPELIIEVGAPVTSSSYWRYAAMHAGCQRWVLSEHGWADPSSNATALLHADPAWTLTELTEALGGFTEINDDPLDAERVAWRKSFSDASTRGWKLVDTELATTPSARPSLMHEGAAVRAAVSALPDNSLLVLGNSLPIRTVDQYVPSLLAKVDVMSQRGASGIDGLVSAATGAASLRRGPTALLLGDVSFIHDIGGLATARRASTPLVIVVIDNAGGRIFEQLPVASTKQGQEVLREQYITRPNIEVDSACSAFGVACLKASTTGALAAAIQSAAKANSCTVIHALVDRHSARDGRDRLLKAIASELG